MDEEPKWYVVHTYSGYENKVKANIEKIVENRGMSEFIREVTVPTQEVVELKNGQRKTVMRKIYPGYVLVKMIMDDDTWYVVRNTRGVTSFVGPGSKPVPLSEDEVLTMGIEQRKKEVIDLAEGDSVMIGFGPFEGSVGLVKEVNNGKRTVVVRISMFGRETPVELDFKQVHKMD
ncbi:MAG: transcription termination/antitermination protein NusG [Clostridiales bacterium]|jgi:transcriptional antiterminator NusG|nr:transcription termination/antitermination protein NusG [Clostridiales bacterium]